jgi:TFIIH basal transcription factor complex TTD-A subunit
MSWRLSTFLLFLLSTLLLSKTHPLLQDATRRPRYFKNKFLIYKLLANLFLSLAGLLIECDPSIKSMILKYDEERHDYIVEDLDDENHLVIKESQLQNLKVRLDQVSTLS